MNIIGKAQEPDDWQHLRQFTSARIALGRTGVSIPLSEILRFKLAHAHAKDAVYSYLDIEKIGLSLHENHLSHCTVSSKAAGREVYLQRPDLGRILNEDSVRRLQDFANHPFDITLVIADGLSATAVNQNALSVAIPFIEAMQRRKLRVAPVVIVKEGRVAIADEIAFIFNAKLSVILIGERPGLTAADSMGAYITYDPRPGYTDERRNCISNIREQGLEPMEAAAKLIALANRAIDLKMSGISLKGSSMHQPCDRPHIH